MPLCINQSGTYRCTKVLCVNQSGTYRETCTGCINQSGTYRLFGTFLKQPGDLGSSFGGGFLICKPGSSPAIVVSPYSAEVSRNYHSRNDAVTRAQQVSGNAGWFVPSKAFLRNPGVCCRSFFGPSPCYSETGYWSNDQCNGDGQADSCTVVFFPSNSIGRSNMAHARCIRAFRCVTY